MASDSETAARTRVRRSAGFQRERSARASSPIRDPIAAGSAPATALIGGAAADLWLRTGRGGARIGRLMRLPRADWGRAVAHGGLGVTFIGVALVTAWTVEDIRVAQVGETFGVAGYQVTLAAVEDGEGPNYAMTMGTVTVERGGALVATLHPEKRFYPVARMPTTEAAIRNGVFGDIYVVIGDKQDGGGWAVRTYVKPFANWIWAGAMLMALGGVLSLTDRRYRVGASAPRVLRVPNPAPAE